VLFLLDLPVGTKGGAKLMGIFVWSVGFELEEFVVAVSRIAL
jgi:hypothetical protein